MLSWYGNDEFVTFASTVQVKTGLMTESEKIAKAVALRGARVLREVRSENQHQARESLDVTPRPIESPRFRSTSATPRFRLQQRPFAPSRRQCIVLAISIALVHAAAKY